MRTTPVSEVRPAYSSTTSQPLPEVPQTNEWAPPDPLDDNQFQKTLDGILNDQPQVNEYIGFLKDMGLDYGWGTTAFVETLLEYIHIYTGAPWWASIALSVLAIRVGIFRFYINAQDTTARMAAIKPLTASIDKSYQEAVKKRDTAVLREVSLQRKAIYEKAGIKPFRAFYPILFQVPLGFGTFRLLRGMSTLPVPGFETGGFLWFTDLTIPDPFFILPLLTGASFFLTFKLGGESGGAATNMNPTTYKVMAYVLPFISGFFALWWPAGLQIPILLSGFLAITQNMLFKQPWFRKLWGIQPLGVMRDAQKATGITRISTAAKPKPKGVVNNVKAAYSDIVTQARERSKAKEAKAVPGRSDADTRKAKAYEEKTTREAAQRRFEAAQAKVAAREEERRQRGLKN